MSRFINAAKIAALSLYWGVVSVGTLGWVVYLSELLGGYFWGTIGSIPIFLASVAVLHPKAFAHDAVIILAKLRKGIRSSISSGNKTYALAVLVNGLVLGGVFLEEGGMGLTIAFLIEFSVIVLLTLFGDTVSKAYALGFEFDFVAGFIIRHKERILTLGGGYTLDSFMNWVYNYPFTATVTLILGATEDRVAVAALTEAVFSLAWLYVYNKQGRDLLGMDEVDEFLGKIINYSGELILGIKLARLVKMGGKLAGFVLLATFRDTFFALLFVRDRAKKTLGAKDFGLALVGGILGSWWILWIGFVTDTAVK